MRSAQLSLFGGGEPSVDEGFGTAHRLELGRGAWMDHVRGWIAGHDSLFAAIEASMRWRSERRVMYERTVDVPRLLGSVPEDGQGHPLVARMASALGDRYGRRFDGIRPNGVSKPRAMGRSTPVARRGITMALYRDGGDSVAWHRDKVRDRDDSIVCVSTLGGSRRFLVRPFGGGESTALTVAGGDLVVMGGTCQRTFEHCVPKTARYTDPRLAIMFRHE